MIDTADSKKAEKKAKPKIVLTLRFANKTSRNKTSGQRIQLDCADHHTLGPALCAVLVVWRFVRFFQNQKGFPEKKVGDTLVLRKQHTDHKFEH